MSHKSDEIKVNASFLRGMGNPAAIAGKEKSLQNSLENSYSLRALNLSFENEKVSRRGIVDQGKKSTMG